MTALKNQFTLLTPVEGFVSNLLSEKLNPSYKFHDFKHTKSVFKACFLLGKKCKLKCKELESLLIAALFHDIGYIRTWKNHEEIGAYMAEEYLNSIGLRKERIKKIASCIRSTSLLIKPKSTIEKIINDADLSHLSQPNYINLSYALREEFENTRDIFLSDEEYFEGEIRFLSIHKYKTDFGIKTLEPLKIENIKLLKRLYSAEY